jgi:hypothetical protein
VSRAGLRHCIGSVLAHVSRDKILRPASCRDRTLAGDSGMETDHRIRPGDTLELAVDGIGNIQHAIIGL